MTIQSLLDTYYKGIHARSGWQDAITDDFSFTGANAGSASEGKAAYGEVMRRFGRAYDTVALKDVTVDGSKVCAVVTYGAVSPSGKKASFDIAEMWTVRDGKLASLRIFFDTAGWNAFMAA
jgi:ketosteroid isomerase-like protein